MYEKIVSLKPDIIFAYAIGKKDMPHIDKLRSLGIPVVYTAEYLEPHPLGRAEWIKFFAAFFDKEHLADTIFNKIEQEYLNIKTKASNIKNKPQVLLNTPFEGIWYLPGTSSYMVQLINDAGGKYNIRHSSIEGYLLHEHRMGYTSRTKCRCMAQYRIIYPKKSTTKRKF